MFTACFNSTFGAKKAKVLPWSISNFLSQKTHDDALDIFFESAIIGDLEEIRELLKFISVNRQDANGNTILHLAAQYQHKEMFEFLKKYPGCDVSITNNDEFTALELSKGVINALGEGIEYPTYAAGYIQGGIYSENYLEEVQPVGMAESISGKEYFEKLPFVGAVESKAIFSGPAQVEMAGDVNVENSAEG